MDRPQSATVIVALPSEDDVVHRYSSEKVPHMTILYLGDVSVSDQARVISFLSHAADTVLNRFWMTVDHRGELGDDKADVLFFDKNKWIEDFRSNLLKNDTINKLYNASEQYPEWIPHLTMGYPESPAKLDERDYPGFHSVTFDRVALWTGGYEGPEYRLKEMRDMEVSMSSIGLVDSLLEKTGKTLAHYGIKGMRWGVRRSDAQLARARGGLSEDAALLSKPAGSLTNAELQSVVNRLNLQRQLAALNPPPKTLRQKGADVSKDILSKVGKKHAENVTDHYVGKLIQKKLGIDPPKGGGSKKKTDKTDDSSKQTDSSSSSKKSDKKTKPTSTTGDKPTEGHTTNNYYYTTYAATPGATPTAPQPPKYTPNYNDGTYRRPSNGPRELLPNPDGIYDLSDLNK